MAESIKVKPTPIQRNSFDVAMELLNIHLRQYALSSPEELQQLFSTYYAVAEVCDRKSATDLQNLVSEEILAKIGRFSTNRSF